MHRAALVQYQTVADSAEQNRTLIQDVVIELGLRDPGGLDYQVFQLENGVGFVHIAVFDGTSEPFADCDAYQMFHRDLQQRLAGPPTISRAVLVGSYFATKR
ncbi:hypothetical protein [Mycobacterium sp. 1245111.1]|uniref:hypothetical protein n=1 Tax=Mycobacterium sp. 1245111.1 TaxID=1834073 RepID=UPI000AA1F7FE|nr:hypothetical protein [Mycobacterium sp. 1245111.1]